MFKKNNLLFFSLQIQWKVLTESQIEGGINFLPMHYFIQSTKDTDCIVFKVIYLAENTFWLKELTPRSSLRYSKMTGL